MAVTRVNQGEIVEENTSQFSIIKNCNYERRKEK